MFTESFKGQETVEIHELPEWIRYKIEELYDTLHEIINDSEENRNSLRYTPK